MTGRTKTNSKNDRPKVLAALAPEKGGHPRSGEDRQRPSVCRLVPILLMITSQEYSQEQP